MITTVRERKRERGGRRRENNMSNARYGVTKTNEIYLYVTRKIRMIKVAQKKI